MFFICIQMLCAGDSYKVCSSQIQPISASLLLGSTVQGPNVTIRPAPFACIDPWPWPQLDGPARKRAVRKKGPKEHRPKSNQHGQIMNVFKDVQEERTRINFVRLRNL